MASRPIVRLLTLVVASAMLAVPLRSSAALPNSLSAPVGSVPPTIVGQSLDGKTIRTSDFAGKVLVLNFWATWCPPCRAETADVIRGYVALHGAKVAFLGVDTTENAAVVKTFVSIKGVPYPTIVTSPRAINAFGIEALPTTVVLDAKGVVRARWIGGIETSRLRAYVADASQGRNATYVTAEQRKIDSMLALAQFSFTGSPSKVAAAIAHASARVAAVAAYTARLNAASTPRYDYERTERETGALELASATAVDRAAKTPAQKVKAALLLASAYGDLNRWSDVANVYRGVLATHPHDVKFTALLANAYYRLHDYTSQAATANTLTTLSPNDSDAWDSLGLAYERAGKFAQAAPAYERAVRLMIASNGSRADKLGLGPLYVADESLNLADVYVALGDAKNAKRVFAQSAYYASLIPKGSPYATFSTRVAERTLEGMTAVAVVRSNGTNVSLTKWTGPDLPGSVASTLKYRLVVVAPANRPVTLSAKGLRNGWIGSFCSDRLCSPNRVSFVEPPTGVKTYEFQLIPPRRGAAPGKVYVGAQGANWVAVPAS
ncbi:MAG TPA: redoxin domain-containing protein [Candidatus Baltobacteraceae bacterium]